MFIVLKNKIKYLVLLVLVPFLASFLQADDIDFRTFKNTQVFNATQNSTVFFRDLFPENHLVVLVFHSIKCPFSKANKVKMDKELKLHETDSLVVIYVNSNPFENKAGTPLKEIDEFAKNCRCTYLLDRNYFVKKLQKFLL